MYLVCRSCSSISVAEDLIHMGPSQCLLIWGQRSSSVESILKNVPIYSFSRTRPKGVSSPLLGNRNYLLLELPLRLEVSLWRLWVSVKTTWAKQFYQYNQKTLLLKTKGLFEVFQVDHITLAELDLLWFSRLPNHCWKFFYERLCISVQHTGPCPGDLSRKLCSCP